MTNAALLIHPDAFDTTRENLLGRHSAGESFLRGFIRHAEVDRLYFWQMGSQAPQRLEAMIRQIEPTQHPIQWIPAAQRGGLAHPGLLNMPGPNIEFEAWARQPYGATAYSLCGLTHTTATARSMDSISNYLLAPVEGHDALICTSSAVRAAVEAQLDGVRDYLKAEYGGPRRRPEPQRVTIPLGVNVGDFETSPEHRKAWRERLDIPADAVVALYVGRFNIHEKMNPSLMALALEKAAQATGRPLYWVNSGWPASGPESERYHDAARARCPSVHYRVVDGRPADVRFSIWSVADLFISFSDNIQESFGLTPVEAMAAGLPCVVTDWDGYRDTVRHGIDGFRVPTLAPAPGEGIDLGYRFAVGLSSYVDYVAGASHFTAIDFEASTEALSALILNADLRRALGAHAKARAREVFDWSAIVPQYQALWADQGARRRAAPPQAAVVENPYRPDPFRLFASYPTHHVARDWRATVSPGTAWPEAKALLSGPLAQYATANRPSLEESERIVTWLADRPGASVDEIVELFPQARRPAIARGLLWIARHGVIVLQPPQ